MENLDLLPICINHKSDKIYVFLADYPETCRALLLLPNGKTGEFAKALFTVMDEMCSTGELTQEQRDYCAANSEELSKAVLEHEIRQIERIKKEAADRVVFEREEALRQATQSESPQRLVPQRSSPEKSAPQRRASPRKSSGIPLAKRTYGVTQLGPVEMFRMPPEGMLNGPKLFFQKDVIEKLVADESYQFLIHGYPHCHLFQISKTDLLNDFASILNSDEYQNNNHCVCSTTPESFAKYIRPVQLVR